MKFQTTKFSTIIIVSLLAFIMTSAVYAEKQTYVKEGTYLGVFMTKNNMFGDFDDSHLFGSDLTGEILGVPKVDEGTGFGVVLGGRGPKGAIELGYQRSRHDTSSFDFGESEAFYNVIDMNFKIDVFAKEQFRPYILLGFGFPWLTIENDLYDVYDDSFGDATFFGFALNAGCGVAYYFHPRWAVTGGVIKRWNWFTSAEGKSLEDTMFERAFCFNVGIAYTF